MPFITHLPKPVECTTSGVNPNVNHGLWVISVCPYRLVSCSKWTMLVTDADHGKGCACLPAGGTWETSVPSLLFCCEPKASLKKKKNVLKKVCFLHRNPGRSGRARSSQMQEPGTLGLPGDRRLSSGQPDLLNRLRGVSRKCPDCFSMENSGDDRPPPESTSPRMDRGLFPRSLPADQAPCFFG